MNDHDALFAGIVAAPDDDAPRFVYADFLDEQGEPKRAEFVRVQCELARVGSFHSPTECALPITSPRYGDCDQCRRWTPERERIRCRERELLDENVIDWLPILDGYTRTQLGGRPGWICDDPTRSIHTEFRRGFVEQVRFARLADAVGGLWCERCGGGLSESAVVVCMCPDPIRTPGLLPAVLAACPLVRDVTEPCGVCKGERVVPAGHERSQRCPTCHGSGIRTVRRGVEVGDRAPYRTFSGHFGWENEGNTADALPSWLWDRLKPKRGRRLYPSADHARDAISAALIALCRAAPQ